MFYSVRMTSVSSRIFLLFSFVMVLRSIDNKLLCGCLSGDEIFNECYSRIPRQAECPSYFMYLASFCACVILNLDFVVSSIR